MPGTPNAPATLTGTIVPSLPSDTDTVAVAWGDGTSSAAVVNNQTHTFAATHIYADNPAGQPSGRFTATATATDENAVTATSAAAIQVVNQPPVITSLTLAGAVNLNVGGNVTITGKFTDPGVLDTHAASVAWGDGSQSAAVVNVALGTFTASHQYANNFAGTPGTPLAFVVTATVTDNSGGQGSATAQQTVGSPVGIAGPLLPSEPVLGSGVGRVTVIPAANLPAGTARPPVPGAVGTQTTLSAATGQTTAGGVSTTTGVVFTTAVTSSQTIAPPAGPPVNLAGETAAPAIAGNDAPAPVAAPGTGVTGEASAQTSPSPNPPAGTAGPMVPGSAGSRIVLPVIADGGPGIGAAIQTGSGDGSLLFPPAAAPRVFPGLVWPGLPAASPSSASQLPLPQGPSPGQTAPLDGTVPLSDGTVFLAPAAVVAAADPATPLSPPPGKTPETITVVAWDQGTGAPIRLLPTDDIRIVTRHAAPFVIEAPSLMLFDEASGTFDEASGSFDAAAETAWALNGGIEIDPDWILLPGPRAVPRLAVPPG